MPLIHRSFYDFDEAHRGWAEKSLKEGINYRDQKWPQSVAVGSEKFVKATKDMLGFQAKGREVIGGGGGYQLKEAPVSDKANLAHENEALRLQNEKSWENSS